MMDWLNIPEVKRLIAAFPKDSLRFVGGAVRDSLLGLPVKDIDAATILRPDQVIDVLTQAGIRAIPTGLAHGTITAVVERRPFEITTLRRDVNADGRHAEVAFTDSWKEDASRRDFTMNAIYLSPEGTLFDYFGGEIDARAGRVVFIGDAAGRIKEDYLRILRYFRFHAYYGKHAPDAAAMDACAANAVGIETLSGERMQQEMMALLSAPVASATLSTMPPDVLRRIFGFTLHSTKSIAVMEKVETELACGPDSLCRLSLLLPSAAALAHLSQKWRLSHALQEPLEIWQKAGSKLKETSDEAAQKKLIRALGRDLFCGLVRICWAQNPEHAVAWRHMYTQAQQWQIPVFPVSGADLIAWGMTPGKAMGERLRQLEEIWENANYVLSKDALLEMPGAEKN